MSVVFGWWIGGPCWRVFDGGRLLAVCGSECKALAMIDGGTP